jgi:hypothetical protein
MDQLSFHCISHVIDYSLNSRTTGADVIVVRICFQAIVNVLLYGTYAETPKVAEYPSRFVAQRKVSAEVAKSPSRLVPQGKVSMYHTGHILVAK